MRDSTSLSAIRSLFMPALILAASLCAGCQTTPTMAPVPSTRLERQGVSLSPPAGSNWFFTDELLLKPGEWHMYYIRKPTQSEARDAPDSTLIILVDVDRLTPEVRRLYPTSRAVLDKMAEIHKAPDDGRFKTLSMASTWTQFAGVECLRHSRITEERDNPQINSLLILETDIFMMCHPLEPTVTLKVTCSTRRRQGSPTVDLKPIAESFIQGVQFTPVKAR